MSQENNTIEVIAEELLIAISPLVEAFNSEDAMLDLLEELGWDFVVVPAGINSMKATSEQALSLVEGETAAEDEEALQKIMDAVKEVFHVIESLKSQGGLSVEFKNEFPGQLIQYLLVEYLLDRQPGIAYLLMTLGIVRTEEVMATGTRLDYQSREFAFSDFNDLFNDPLVFFKNAYSWGEPSFKGSKLITNIYGLINSWGLNAYEEALDEDSLDQLNQGAVQTDEAMGTALKLIFFEDSVDVASFNTGIGLFLLPETVTQKPGFCLLPFASSEIEESFDITENLELGYKGELDLTGGLGIKVRPNNDIEILTGLGVGTPSAVTGNIEILLQLASEEEAFILLGKPNASRLQLVGVSTKGGTRFHSGGKFEIFTEFALEDGKIVIKADSDESDGFISKVLPKEEMEINFNLALGFSSTQGLYFGGSSGLEVVIPTHIDFGVLEVHSLLISLKPKVSTDSEPFSLPLDLAATLLIKLGPLKAIVENFGFRANSFFPNSNDGNLGPLDLSLGIRPPNGVGLTIDAGAVKGGGYLFFDFDREEYAGALELVISEWIALKAIGMITTKLPDGSKGFSLIIIISVEFGTGIQLGFGFTLLGVGGLLGLNRTVKIEPLAEGVRTGAADRIMFPQDVVANAPRIISDLRSFFPAKNDQFLIGPMAKIGYGTPTLISLSLGVIIEFPTVSITILGVLKATLPDENAEVLKLQVNFIGRIEPSNKLLWFYAELFDSRILFLTIEGGMGLLVNWGDQSNFVLSVGGFHPRYTPPPLPFPEPPRLAITLLNESYAKVRIEGYFAVTSNTAQFGARVEVFFGASEFNVDGFFAFDALFQFDPFYFIFELSLSLSVKLFGMGLFSVGFNGLLEGPTPWHIKGKGKIGFWLFSVSIPFEETWGEERQTELPPIEILPLIQREFEAITNWEAVVPASSNILVTLRQLGESVPATAEAIEVDNTKLVLHPVGKLRVSQRKMPLNLELDKLGNQRPNDVNKLSVTAIIEGGDSLLATPYVKEKFATGEFRDLDENSKLSSPGFELYDSGIEIKPKGEQLKTSMAVKRIIRYETIIIDNNFKRHQFPFFSAILVKFSGVYASLFSHFIKGSAVTKSPLSDNQRKQLQPNNLVIQVLPNQYSVAFNDNNKPIDSEAMSFSSQANATDYMREEIRKNPNAANQMHVIPNTEINIAA